MGQRAQEAAWTLEQGPHHSPRPVPQLTQCPICLTLTLPAFPLLPPSHLPNVPTSVPMASTTKSADLPTWPVSRPGPQARTFCTPASGLTCTSKGLDQEGAGVSAGRCTHQGYPSCLPSESQVAHPSSHPVTAQTGWHQGSTGLTCGEWHSRPM